MVNALTNLRFRTVETRHEPDFWARVRRAAASLFLVRRVVVAPLPDELLEEVLPDPRCEDQSCADHAGDRIEVWIPEAVGDDWPGEIRNRRR